MRRLRRVVAAGEEARLDVFAAEWLTAAMARSLTKSAVRRLIMAGAVRVDGRAARRPGLVLRAGTQLEAAVDERRLSSGRQAMPAPTEIPVLFEDEALIAVAKPPGLPTHASADPSRLDLFTLVRRQLAEREGDSREAAPYLGLHHRLDRDTSGIVLFTKLESANAGLAAQFAARSVEKVYHALVVRPRLLPRGTWRVEDELAPVGTGRRSRVSRVSSGGQAAATSFAILERFAHVLLVEARPHTGRKHQVRAHLSGFRIPILGDERYGGPTRVSGVPIARPLLHAHRLALAHPLTGARLDLTCPYPPDFLDALERMRRLDTIPPSR